MLISELLRVLGRTALLLCTVAPISACMNKEFGLSSVAEEWERRRSEQSFSLLSVTPQRAVVSARGKLIAIDPADGFCVSEESIDVSQRSVFALLGDCVVERVAASAKTGAGGRLKLPDAVHGIMTVSISGEGVFGQTGEAGVEALERFLETARGRRMLGRGSGEETVTIEEKRRIGDALFVYVRDADREVVPLLAPKFWRAFVDVNERLAVVTFSGFRDNPMNSEQMLEHLSQQVDRLRAGNVTEPEPVETVVAEATTLTPPPFPEALRTATAVLAGAEDARLAQLNLVEVTEGYQPDGLTDPEVPEGEVVEEEPSEAEAFLLALFQGEEPDRGEPAPEPEQPVAEADASEEAETIAAEEAAELPATIRIAEAPEAPEVKSEPPEESALKIVVAPDVTKTVRAAEALEATQTARTGPVPSGPFAPVPRKRPNVAQDESAAGSRLSASPLAPQQAPVAPRRPG